MILSIKQCTKSELNLIIEFLQKTEYVSFESWQDYQSMIEVINDSNSIIYIAITKDNCIKGVIIGGILGTRATINHIAVDNEMQNNKIASTLYKKFITHIKERKINKIFLFVDKKNIKAINFWKKLNFYETIGEVTMEKNV